LAAWLHDIGHLLSKLEGSPTLFGKDDRHEIIGSKYLSSIFPDAVSKPIELHVDAKRFLVSTEPVYRDQLSLDSIRSLELQGGIMTMDECHHFLSKPYAAESIQLRRWDDLGKKSDCKMPELDIVIDELEDLALGCI
jgi:predicted HD phosphohydrolase